MTRQIHEPNQFSSSYYSRKLGKCDEYICIYKCANRHSSYLEAYNEILERMEIRDNLLERLQAIYYELSEARKVHDFGEYLQGKDIIGNTRTIFKIFENAFINRENLMTKSMVDKYKLVLKHYDTYKGTPNGN